MVRERGAGWQTAGEQARAAWQVNYHSPYTSCLAPAGLAGPARRRRPSPLPPLQGLLDEGNKRRKTESTDANSVSSRSHAVLEINVRRSPRNHYRVQQLCAKLALVDLAGSERAAGARGRVWGAVRTVWGRQYTAGGPGGQRVVSKCKGGWGGGGSTRAAIRRPKYDWGSTKASWTHWKSLGVELSRQRQCQKSSASPPLRHQQCRPEAARRRQHQPLASRSGQLHQCAGQAVSEQGCILCALP